MSKLFFVAGLSVFLISCTSSSIIDKNMTMVKYDKDTKYNILETNDGFDITILYTRYQFIPESSAVAAACKNQLTAIAWEESDKRSRAIQPINEQRIKISMGRNGFSGITSCGAQAKVNWIK